MNDISRRNAFGSLALRAAAAVECLPDLGSGALERCVSGALG